MNLNSFVTGVIGGAVAGGSVGAAAAGAAVLAAAGHEGYIPLDSEIPSFFETESSPLAGPVF